MSANRSVDRSAVAHEKNRSSLCSFTFADGRHCRTPRCSAHPHLCYFHARKEAQTLAYLRQTLLQSIHLAQDEYINAFGTDYWRRTIRSSFAEPAPATEPSPKPNRPLSATPRLK
jgi:hypothetical protein